MKIASCLGLLSAGGYLVLAPAGPSECPAAAGAPLSVAPGVRLCEPEARAAGGGSVAPPLESTLPDELL